MIQINFSDLHQEASWLVSLLLSFYATGLGPSTWESTQIQVEVHIFYVYKYLFYQCTQGRVHLKEMMLNSMSACAIKIICTCI